MYESSNKSSTFNYKLIKKVGVLSSVGDYSKEVNVIAFNDGEPKVDIRTWHEGANGREMRKGVTLGIEEYMMLADLMNGIKDIDELFGTM